jgi:cell division protein FtsQ
VPKTPPAPPTAEEIAAERHKKAFAERKKAARRAGWARAGKWTLGIVIPVGLVAMVYFSPVFAVREGDIAVRGIAGAAKPDQISVILEKTSGTPLARLSTGEVVQDLEKLPGVKSAEVRRKWPTGLSVTIVPRVAAAAVKDAGQYVLLDSEAVQVDRVATIPEGLPEVSVPLIEGNKRILAAVLGVVGSMPESLSSKVTSIGAATEDTVTFTLKDGITVIWGDASDASVKAGVVGVLETQPGVTSIDVTAPEFPVVR